MTDPLPYEQIDELVDTDPLALRNYAWAMTRDHARLTAEGVTLPESVALLNAENQRLRADLAAAEADAQTCREMVGDERERRRELADLLAHLVDTVEACRTGPCRCNAAMAAARAALIPVEVPE